MSARRTPERSRAAARAMIVVAAVTSAAPEASAHDVGLSQSDFTMEGGVVRAHMVLAAPDLEGLLDVDHDGRVTIAEVDAGRPSLATLVSRETEVTAGAKGCPGRLEGVSVEGVDGVALDATFPCPEASGELSVVLHWLGARPPGHRHVARLVAGKRTMSAVLTRERPGTSIALDAPPPAGPSPDVRERTASWWWWAAGAALATIALFGLRKLRYNRRP